jgi:hypothetical protein
MTYQHNVAEAREKILELGENHLGVWDLYPMETNDTNQVCPRPEL